MYTTRMVNHDAVKYGPSHAKSFWKVTVAVEGEPAKVHPVKVNVIIFEVSFFFAGRTLKLSSSEQLSLPKPFYVTLNNICEIISAVLLNFMSMALFKVF